MVLWPIKVWLLYVLPLVIHEQNKWSESRLLWQWMPLEGQQQIDMNDVLGNLEETCLWCTTCTFSCVKTHLQNSAHDLPSLLSVLGWCPHFSRSFENEIWRTLCGWRLEETGDGERGRRHGWADTRTDQCVVASEKLERPVSVLLSLLSTIPLRQWRNAKQWEEQFTFQRLAPKWGVAVYWLHSWYTDQTKVLFQN